LGECPVSPQVSTRDCNWGQSRLSPHFSRPRIFP